MIYNIQFLEFLRRNTPTQSIASRHLVRNVGRMANGYHGKWRSIFWRKKQSTQIKSRSRKKNDLMILSVFPKRRQLQQRQQSCEYGAMCASCHRARLLPCNSLNEFCVRKNGPAFCHVHRLLFSTKHKQTHFIAIDPNDIVKDNRCESWFFGSRKMWNGFSSLK